MKVVELPGGYAVEASFPEPELLTWIKRTTGDCVGALPLIIADPPYGNIVDDKWDRIDEDDVQFCEWMLDWTRRCAELSVHGAALYVWGGIGKPGFRPFYRYLTEVERKTDYEQADHITWAKKRAYGTKTRYLFTREEIAYLVRGEAKRPRMFNIPLLDQKRGYAGYNKKYPAKSEYLRRTNVWTDVTEIFKGKVHTAQKPDRLHEIMIEVHTKSGEWVLDPFAGSGTTARAARKLDRKFVIVEKNPRIFEECVESLRK